MYSATLIAKQGWTGRLVYPDLFDQFVSVGDIPDQDVLAVITILRSEGSIPAADYIQKIMGDVRHYARLYRLAALCLETPHLVLMRRKCPACGHVWDGELKTCDQCMEVKSVAIPDRNEGEIGPRDLTVLDLIAIHNDFFWTKATAIGPADAHITGGAAELAHAGNGIRDDAGHVDGDHRSEASVQPEPMLSVG